MMLRGLTGALASALLAVALVPAGAAATVGNVRISSPILVVDGGSAADAITVSNGADSSSIQVTDPGGASTSDPACTDNGASVSCPVAGLTTMSVHAGDGNDRIDLGGAVGTKLPLRSTVRGDNGDDTLLGSAGLDALVGSTGNDWLQGFAGADAFLGGLGADTLLARDGERDQVSCSGSPTPNEGDTLTFDWVDSLSTCHPTIIGVSLRASFDVSGDSTDVNRLKLLHVPAETQVVVTCAAKQGGCPFKHKTFTPASGTLNFARLFNAGLSSGTLIQIQATAPSFQGRVYRLRFRRDRPPKRKALCLLPGGRTKAAACV